MGVSPFVTALMVTCGMGASAEPAGSIARRGDEYLEERSRLIAAEQGCEERSGADWNRFVSTLGTCRVLVESPIAKSEAYQRYLRQAKEPDECSVADALFAVTGQIENKDLEAEAEKALARFEQTDAMVNLDRLGEAGRCYSPPRETGLLQHSPGPELTENLRAFGLASRARIALAIRAGDVRRFRDAIRQSMLVARVACFQGNHVSAILANTIRVMTIRQLVESPALPPGFAGAALEELARAKSPRWEFTFECDRRSAFYDLDTTFRATPDRMQQSPIWFERLIGYLFIGSRTEQFQLLDWVYGGLAATFETDVEKRRLAQAGSARAFQLCEGKWTGARYRLAAMMMPNAAALSRTARVGRMEFEGGMATLAVMAFKETDGCLPKTLSDLVPRFIPAVPSDWYGPNPGLSPLKYRVLDPAEDTEGRMFLVYSVGLDGVDDRGKEPPGLPGDAMTPPGHGTDYVVSRRRRAGK